MPPINQGGTPNQSQGQGQGGQDQGQNNQNQGNQGNQSQGQGGTPNQGQDQGNQNQGGQGANFESWYAGLGADHKGLIDGHVTGLKSALDAERNERKALAKQIGDLKARAEKGSDLEKQLGDLTATLEAQNAKTTFYEGAPGDVSNPRLAYLAAQEGNHINAKTGAVDWAAMRAAYPELFRRQGAGAPPANGGQGRNQGGNIEPNMNLFIRRAAGRG